MVNVKCKAGYVLNPKYDICQKQNPNCTKQQYYDFATKKCTTVQYVTSPYEPDEITSGSFTSYVTSYDKAKSTNSLLKNCLPATPFFQKSSQSCISCPSGTPYFDISTDKCVKCGFSQVYNPYQHKCVSQRQTGSYPSTVNRIHL